MSTPQELKELENKIKNEIEALNTRLCENSLADFTKQAWHIIEPGTPLMWNWHLDTLCGYLEATMDKHVHLTRLIINIPPGSLKSVLVSVMFPAWMWIKNPQKRVLGVSNSQDLAIRDSRRTKQIITDEWFTDKWPLALKADQSAKTNYENEAGGFRVSLGITANITGKRGDCFTASTLVDTEFGPKLITEINAGDLVWSWNTKIKQKELQPVEALYSSQKDAEVITLNLSNGVTITCTPDHKIWTEERGMVKAKYLSIPSSYRIDSSFADSKLLTKTNAGKFHIANFSDVLTRICTATFVWIKQALFFRFIAPVSTCFYSPNSPISNTVKLSNSYTTSAIKANSSGFIRCKKSTGPVNTHRKSTVFDRVLHIIGLSTICNISKNIVKTVSVKMSNLMTTSWIRTNKCFSYSLMGVNAPYGSVNIRADSKITFPVFTKTSNKPFFNVGLTSFFSNSSIQTTNSTSTRNVIYTLKSGDGLPLFVTNTTTHKTKSPVYCLQVKNNNNMFVGTKQGAYLLASNCIILDDPHDAVTAQSDLIRQGVLDIYDTKLSTRVNSQQHSVIILIMQRLHAQDLTGHLLLKKKTKWVHVVMPMHYDSSFTFDAGKHIGRSELNDPRKDDDLLFTDLFPQDVVEKLEEDMGTYASAGQLEQRPSPKGGGILRQAWFRILDSTAELPVCDHIFISCDTAYSEKDMISNSFSAFTTWGVFWNPAQQRDCILLLDVWYGQVDYPELRRHAHKMDKDKKPDVWLIEKKASGQSLVQDLRQSGLMVRTYVPTTDKVSRAYAVQPMLESGQVWIPDRKWAHAFAYKMGTFPTGDPVSFDLADTCTQALLYIRNGMYVSHPDDLEHDKPEVRRVSAYGGHSTAIDKDENPKSLTADKVWRD